MNKWSPLDLKFENNVNFLCLEQKEAKSKISQTSGDTNIVQTMCGEHKITHVIIIIVS